MTDNRYRLSAGCIPESRVAADGQTSDSCILESRVAPAAPGFYGLSAFQRGEAATTTTL